MQLTLDAQYGVTLGVGNAVTVTPIALPAAPRTLLILRNTPAVQATDFLNLGSFSPGVHTNLHDASAMRDGEERFHRGRALKAPLGETLDDVPRAAARAEKFLAFDAAGQTVAVGGTIGTVVAIASLITNDSDVPGATVAAALDELEDEIGALDSEIGALQASDIGNDSAVPGASVAAALAGLGTSRAPSAAQYLVGALDSGLNAERVVTDTASVTWDLATSGQAKANVIAASDTVAGVIELADQAEQEAGSATNRAVVPGRQQFHPSAVKGWAYVNVVVGIHASYNVSGVTDLAVAVYVSIGTRISAAPTMLFWRAASTTIRRTTQRRPSISRRALHKPGTGAEPAKPTRFLWCIASLGDQ